MDLLPSADQEALLAGAREFLVTALPVDASRWRDRDAVEARALKEFASLGWYGVGLPEPAGGLGLGAAEEALLLAEAGKYLAPIGLLAGMLAARVAWSTGLQDVASTILTGECRVGLVIPAQSGNVQLIDATASEQVVVLDSSTLCLASCSAFHDREPQPSLDQGVTLERASQIIPQVRPCESSGATLYLHAVVLVCALMVGLSEAVMEVAVAHAKQRQQFGQSIGVFQAVKHPLADMAVRAEAARFQTMMAALSIADARPDASFQTHAAAVIAGRAATANAHAAVQIFGAMGYTQECVVHHFVKRAVLLNRIIDGRLKQIDFLIAEKPSL